MLCTCEGLQLHAHAHMYTRTHVTAAFPAQDTQTRITLQKLTHYSGHAIYLHSFHFMSKHKVLSRGLCWPCSVAPSEAMNVGPDQINFNKGFLHSAPRGERFQATEGHDCRKTNETIGSLPFAIRFNLAHFYASMKHSAL